MLPGNFKDRFLEEIENYEAGAELTACTTLTLERDVFLRDRSYSGQHWFPLAFGLEAMAQAVARVLGCNTLGQIVIEDIEVLKPIEVDPNRGCKIQIAGYVNRRDKQETSVLCSVRSVEPGDLDCYYLARFVIYKSFCPERAIIDNSIPGSQDMDAATFYKLMPFHGPAFQRICGTMKYTQNRCIFSAIENAKDEWILRDPYFLDALLQPQQICALPNAWFPSNIARIQYSSSDATGKNVRLCETRIVPRADIPGHGSHVIATDKHGLVEIIVDKAFSVCDWHGPQRERKQQPHLALSVDGHKDKFSLN